MFYGVYLYMMILVALVLAISAIILAVRFKQPKIAWALLLGGIMLPTSYVGAFQAMKAGGWVVSETNGLNEMKPIGPIEPK